MIVFQINYWVKDEQNETMALFRIIRNQTDHGMIIALREDTDYWVNVQVLNSGLNLGPKSEIYPVRTLRAGTYSIVDEFLCCCDDTIAVLSHFVAEHLHCHSGFFTLVTIERMTCHGHCTGSATGLHGTLTTVLFLTVVKLFAVPFLGILNISQLLAISSCCST